MQDLLELHEKLLFGTRLGSDGKEEAFDMLKGKEHKDRQYGKALRFVVDKGLAPGLSFLNGRIFDDEKAFMDEQRQVFGMIAKGDITDSSPNSVYAHLLSSGPVFPKLHPLLASGVTKSANYMESPKTAIPDAAVSAYFVVDFVMECSTL